MGRDVFLFSFSLDHFLLRNSFTFIDIIYLSEDLICP